MLGQQAPPVQPAPPEKKEPVRAPKQIGPLEISVNWRTRTEGWEWFQGNT